jgi:S-formylglutathione hydrolase FrmB
MTVRPRRRHTRLAAGGTAVALALAVPAVATTAQHATAQPAAHDRMAPNSRVDLHGAHGVHVDRVQRVGARQLQATITPTALGRALGVRIVLPRHYDPQSRHRYPTLYLFPGTSGRSWDWSVSGHAPQATRHDRLITVTSDIGFDGDGGSWFSNWVDRKTSYGRAQWETYNVHQLIPWIDANLATIRNRSGRAVAGLSQGGYGATELAARHPDLFTEMGSFSGAPEIDRDPEVRAGAAAIIDATMTGLNRVEPDAPFGDHVTDEINWEGHDPARSIGNLRGIGLWFATADGAPGKYDHPVTDPQTALTAGAIEAMTHASTDTFIEHLNAARIPYRVYDYGSGSHTWPYWARDFKRFLPVLMQRFAHPPATRHHVYYRGIQGRWSEFGWQVRLHRPQVAFTTLSHADHRGFRLSGVGSALVTTPRDYVAHRSYRVTIGSSHRTVRATRNDRLRIDVPLGTSAHQVGVRIAA